MSDLQQRADRLRARVEQGPPESWVATEAGQHISGIFKRLEGPFWDKHRGEVFSAVIEETTGGREVSVRLLHTALQNEFQRRHPVAGELVLFEYLGMQEPKGGGQAYHNWKVLVDRDDDAAGQWARFSATAGGDPEEEARQAAETPVPHASAAQPQPHEPASQPAGACPSCGAGPTQAHEMWCEGG